MSEESKNGYRMPPNITFHSRVSNNIFFLEHHSVELVDNKEWNDFLHNTR